MGAIPNFALWLWDFIAQFWVLILLHLCDMIKWKESKPDIASSIPKLEANLVQKWTGWWLWLELVDASPLLTLKRHWEGIASPVGDLGSHCVVILPGDLGTASNNTACSLLLELRLSVTLVRLILMCASVKTESSPYVQPCMWLQEVPWMGSILESYLCLLG